MTSNYIKTTQGNISLLSIKIENRDNSSITILFETKMDLEINWDINYIKLDYDFNKDQYEITTQRGNIIPPDGRIGKQLIATAVPYIKQ